MINGKEHEFPIAMQFFHREHKIDISRYVDDGFNTVTFHAPSLGRSVKVYIELVEKYAKPIYQDDEE